MTLFLCLSQLLTQCDEVDRHLEGEIRCFIYDAIKKPKIIFSLLSLGNECNTWTCVSVDVIIMFHVRLQDISARA